MAGVGVVVVGSINRDTVLGVDRLPVPGETVFGRHLGTFPGGKGANQAVAAARLGRPVAMVARVGADAAGIASLHGLTAEGIDIDGVQTDRGAPTGSATIMVDAAGENTIVVVPGANANVGLADVAAASGVLAGAAVTLLQLEVPMAAVAAAVRASSGGAVVLNAAPARAITDDILAGVDVLVVNATELAALGSGVEAAATGDIVDQVGLLEFGGSVVVTRGAAGAVVVSAADVVEVPSIEVDVVDTTGAGDAFCGGLADALARGATLVEATRWAVRVGAAAATRMGAQEALPTADQVAEHGS